MNSDCHVTIQSVPNRIQITWYHSKEWTFQTKYNTWTWLNCVINIRLQFTKQKGNIWIRVHLGFFNSRGAIQKVFILAQFSIPKSWFPKVDPVRKTKVMEWAYAREVPTRHTRINMIRQGTHKKFHHVTKLKGYGRLSRATFHLSYLISNPSTLHQRLE